MAFYGLAHKIEVRLAKDSGWQERPVPQRLMSHAEAQQKCRELNRVGRLLGLKYRVRPFDVGQGVSSRMAF